jgi:hypothetical protein
MFNATLRLLYTRKNALVLILQENAWAPGAGLNGSEEREISSLHTG